MNTGATDRVTPVTWKAGEAEKTILKTGIMDIIQNMLKQSRR